MIYKSNNTDPVMEIHPIGNGHWRIYLGFTCSYHHTSEWFPTLKEAKRWAALEYKWYRLKHNPPKRITWRTE